MPYTIQQNVTVCRIKILGLHQVVLICHAGRGSHISLPGVPRSPLSAGMRLPPIYPRLVVTYFTSDSIQPFFNFLPTPCFSNVTLSWLRPSFQEPSWTAKALATDNPAAVHSTIDQRLQVNSQCRYNWHYRTRIWAGRWQAGSFSAHIRPSNFNQIIQNHLFLQKWMLKRATMTQMPWT